MTLDELLKEVEKLQGIWLSPLGNAKRIRVVDIDRAGERVVLEVDGQERTKTRPFSEFRRLLSALNSQPAIHVDSVLAGSGSSRSQPETILAHLPSIEVVYVARRKHLAKVAEPSHAYGTVREMDPFVASQLVHQVAPERKSEAGVGFLVVTNEPRAVVSVLRNSLRRDPTQDGVSGAFFQFGGVSVWIAAPTPELAEGAIPVLPSLPSTSGATEVSCGTSVLQVKAIGGVRFACVKP